jgi:hypothetical protein
MPLDAAAAAAGDGRGVAHRAHGSAACPRVLQLTIAKEADVDLSWLDRLPHAPSLCAHVCLKGLRCDSPSVRATIGGWEKMRLHSCIEEPGGHENGHEGVCAFRFLLDHYDDPTWRGVFFLHGVTARRTAPARRAPGAAHCAPRDARLLAPRREGA